MQGEFRIEVDCILVEVAFGTVVKHVMSREGVKLFEFIRRHQVAEGLIGA
jgi:hypothetical protein